MRSLNEILQQTEARQVALGHFNVADLVFLKAVFQAAQALNAPVLVGASEGEREFAGTRQLAALVRSLREEFDYPIFLNADHTHSLMSAMEAEKAGFDAVVFDLSSLPLEENARQTRQAVEALKSVNSAVLVEGEIGDIGTGSDIHEDAPRSAQPHTTASEARQFVGETRVDILAPAVGNTHGMRESMVTGHEKKHLHIERISEIKRAAGIPLTLHGGSGTSDEDFQAAIRAGVNIVHINTELRLAWRCGLEQASPREKTKSYRTRFCRLPSEPSSKSSVHDCNSLRIKFRIVAPAERAFWRAI
jgi:fructose-bisphosphate aldolase, class II